MRLILWLTVLLGPGHVYKTFECPIDRWGEGNCELNYRPICFKFPQSVGPWFDS